MTRVFNLSVECGTEQSQAEKFAEHFRDLTWMINSGIQSQCRSDIFANLEGNW